MPDAVSAALAADVTLTSANTFYDGPTLTVGRGTWLIVAHVTVIDSSGSGAKFTAKLSDGSTDFVSAEEVTHAPTFYGNESVTLRLSWVVTPTSSTTYTAKVASTVGSTGLIKATVPHNSSHATASLISASPAFGTAATAALAADASITSANTFVDGPSVTLSAGTWLLVGNVTLLDTAGAGQFTAKLWEGSAAVAAGEEKSQAANDAVAIPLSAIVTPTGSTTYKISVAGGSTTGKIKAACPENGAGNNASALVAVKVATGSSDSLGASVAINSSNTYYDGPTLTLGAGTWLLVGQVTLTNSAFASDFTAQIWDGAAEFATGEAQTQSGSDVVVIGIGAIVSPASSTTYTLRVAAVTAAAFSTFIQRFTPDNFPTNGTASVLCAIQIGSSVSHYDIPVLAADCKVFSLWNGSSNNAPPTNWESPTFDDSAWSTAVSPTLNPSNSYGAVSWTAAQWPDLPVPASSSTPNSPPAGVELVSRTTGTPGTSERFLIRWRFFLPVMTYNAIDSAIWTAGTNHSGTARLAPNLAASLNGSTTQFVFGSSVLVSLFNTWGLPGATNLITHEVNGFGTAEAWIAEMWEALFLRFSNTSGSVFPSPTAGRRGWAAVVG